MSNKDPTDGLTDKQRDAFDKYTELCAKNFDKLSLQMQMGCSSQLATLGIMAKQKKAQQDMLDQVGLLQTRLEEVTIVNDWIGRWQTQSMAMLSAFVNASYTYDMILGLKSREPVDFNIILELAITLLPEIKPLQRIFQSLVRRDQVFRSPGGPAKDTVDALAQIGITVRKTPDYIIRQLPSPKTPEALNLLDKRSDDLTNVARGWAKSGGGNILDAASVKLKSGYQAKNQIFKELIVRTVEILLAATAAVPDFNTAILQSKITKADLLDKLNKTKGAGDPGKVLTAEQYELLANQILYQMLRAYMQKYGKVTHVKWKSRSPGLGGGSSYPAKDLNKTVPTEGSYDNAEGLDSKGFDQIFDLFNSRNWKGDTKFPPIDNVQDMVKKWNVPMTNEESGFDHAWGGSLGP